MHKLHACHAMMLQDIALFVSGIATCTAVTIPPLARISNGSGFMCTQRPLWTFLDCLSSLLKFYEDVSRKTE